MSQPATLIQPSWYVVQTKPKQEFRALAQLENQQYTCFIPTLKWKKFDVEKAKSSRSHCFPATCSFSLIRFQATGRHCEALGV